MEVRTLGCYGFDLGDYTARLCLARLVFRDALRSVLNRVDETLPYAGFFDCKVEDAVVVDF